MKKGPFKMKKFSGFGNSPAKQTAKEKFDKRQASKQKAKDFAKDPRIKRNIDLKDTYKKAKTKMATDFNYENKKALNQKFKNVVKKGKEAIGSLKGKKALKNVSNVKANLLSLLLSPKSASANTETPPPPLSEYDSSRGEKIK